MLGFPFFQLVFLFKPFPAQLGFLLEAGRAVLAKVVALSLAQPMASRHGRGHAACSGATWKHR